MAKTYNGHHCWNCWNIALWIANREDLYRLAIDCKRSSTTMDAAAKLFMSHCDSGTTPDGARYTLSGVKAALRGLE